jgi:hypothetical protein
MTAPQSPRPGDPPLSAPAEPAICPLCAAPAPPEFALREGRRYLRCSRCSLTFLDPAFRLGPAAERARYETHNNAPDDPGYRAFLARLAVPLLKRLSPGARGLDFGSGPGPTLSGMLSEAGFPTRIWDPFFAPDHSALEERYDFVTCSETAEHFHRPGDEFRRLDGLLRPGGWLGVMTGVLHPEQDFGTWWYVRDPTHVAFYAPATLQWIAERHRWTLEVVAPSVILFQKGVDL